MAKALRTTTILSVAALLLVVGVGNLAIGLSKSAYYTQALEEASTPTPNHPHGKHPSDSLYMKSLRSRAHYYGIVRSGGVGMLAIGCALLIGCALQRRSH